MWPATEHIDSIISSARRRMRWRNDFTERMHCAMQVIKVICIRRSTSGLTQIRNCWIESCAVCHVPCVQPDCSASLDVERATFTFAKWLKGSFCELSRRWTEWTFSFHGQWFSSQTNFELAPVPPDTSPCIHTIHRLRQRNHLLQFTATLILGAQPTSH